MERPWSSATDGAGHAHGMTRRERPHVLIAGGGIGGLTAALALLRRGFDVDVYEQAPELREVGAGVQISANGSRALYALGVGEDVARLSCEASGKEIRLWSTGQTWKLFDLGAESVARYGFPYFTVYRPDLLSALADGVRRVKPGSDPPRREGRRVLAGRRPCRAETGGRGARPRAMSWSAPTASIRASAKELFGAGPAEFAGLVRLARRDPHGAPAAAPRAPRRHQLGRSRPPRHPLPAAARRAHDFVGIVERTDWKVESWTARGTTGELAADFAGWHATYRR